LDGLVFVRLISSPSLRELVKKYLAMPCFPAFRWSKNFISQIIHAFQWKKNSRSQIVQHHICFFLKRGKKLCSDLLIKKKRIAQLINGKLDKNHYNKATREQRQNTSDLRTNKRTQPTTTSNKRHQEHHTTSNPRNQ
jgi:hypothetical protein